MGIENENLESIWSTLWNLPHSHVYNVVSNQGLVLLHLLSRRLFVVNVAGEMFLFVISRWVREWGRTEENMKAPNDKIDGRRGIKVRWEVAWQSISIWPKALVSLVT